MLWVPTRYTNPQMLLFHGTRKTFDRFDLAFYGKGAYLCGTSIVVLDEDIIDIVEVLPAEQLFYEMIGDAKQHELADTQQELGKTGVMSFLRRLTDLERS